MHAVRDDPEVRVVIFKGAGDRAFSAGADIREFGTAPSYAEARRARRERDLWGFMLSLDCRSSPRSTATRSAPASSCRCAATSASPPKTPGSACPRSSLGYIPSAGGTQTLPRHVPPGIAMQMILTGDPIDAADRLPLRPRAAGRPARPPVRRGGIAGAPHRRAAGRRPWRSPSARSSRARNCR